jgi:hypothetical protein
MPQHLFTATVMEDFLMVCGLKSNRPTLERWRDRFSDLASALNPALEKDIEACTKIADMLDIRVSFLRQQEGQEVLDGL